MLVKEGDELTEEVLQPPPPAGHRDGQGLRVVHARSTCATRWTRSSAASARASRARDRRRRPRDGEVIAETGQSLTDTLIKKLRKAEINKVKVFVASGRAESTLIKNTLAKDPTQAPRRGGARAADLRAAASRRRAQPRDGEAGARASVLLAEALRPRSRRPLQDQPAARA